MKPGRRRRPTTVTPGDTLPVDDLCRKCRRPIAFVVTAKSAGDRDPKHFPLDPRPTPTLGNIQLYAHAGRLVGAVRTGLELEALRADNDPLYVAHFATCPARRENR